MLTNTPRLIVSIALLMCIGAAAQAQSINHQRAAGLLQLFMFAASAPPATDRLVNVNTADAQTLEAKLIGLSAEEAAAIVAYRSRHGDFHNMRDLLLVENLDTGVVWRNQHLLTY